MKKLVAIFVAAAALALSYGARAVEPEDVDIVVDALTQATFRDWKSKATKGDLLAPVIVGRAYDKGKGTSENQAEAVAWYRKALGYGNPLAAYLLGGMYDVGRGVPKDYKFAFRYYKEAADKGIAAAQDSVGVFYGSGRGVKLDLAEAVKWHRMAAEKGYAPAQSNLGYFYQTGMGGLKQDYAQAVR